MRNRILTSTMGLAVVALTAAVLAGCAPSSAPTPTPTTSAASSSAPSTAASGGSGLVAPIMIDFYGGTAQFATVSLGNVVVITTGSTAVTSFTGDVGEPTIAKFVPGHVDGSATFNPGIQPLAIGATTVTITDTATSRFVMLDLTVTP